MFDLKTISLLNDSLLIENFSVSVQKEREILSEIIAHLSQILKRQLYLKEGYSSLFNYLREKFHYSESAAYRRIQAAKVTLLYPEILELLEKGKVNLSTLSLIESELTRENARSVIDQIVGKSKREVEYLLVEMSVPRKSMVMQDRIRRIKIEFVAEEGMAKKIERAKEILRHKFPECRFEDIFNQALEDLLEKRDPMRKIERAEKRNEKKVIKCEQKIEKEEEKRQESEEKINESEKKTEKRELSQALGKIKKTTNHLKEIARHFPSALCVRGIIDGRKPETSLRST